MGQVARAEDRTGKGETVPATAARDSAMISDQPPTVRLPPSQDPAWVRWSLTGAALMAITILVIVPVVSVFVEAFADGAAAYWQNLVGDPDTRASILLTLFVAPGAVVANTVFGVAAAWAVTRFRFRGRTLLVTLI